MHWPQVLIIIWLTLNAVKPAFDMRDAAFSEEAVARLAGKLIGRLVGVAIFALVLGAGGFWS